MQKSLSKKEKPEYQTTSIREARELREMGFMCRKEYLSHGKYIYIFEDSTELQCIRRDNLFGDDNDIDFNEISPI